MTLFEDRSEFVLKKRKMQSDEVKRTETVATEKEVSRDKIVHITGSGEHLDARTVEAIFIVLVILAATLTTVINSKTKHLKAANLLAGSQSTTGTWVWSMIATFVFVVALVVLYKLREVIGKTWFFPIAVWTLLLVCLCFLTFVSALVLGGKVKKGVVTDADISKVQSFSKAVTGISWSSIVVIILLVGYRQRTVLKSLSREIDTAMPSAKQIAVAASALNVVASGATNAALTGATGVAKATHTEGKKLSDKLNRAAAEQKTKYATEKKKIAAANEGKRNSKLSSQPPEKSNVQKEVIQMKRINPSLAELTAKRRATVTSDQKNEGKSNDEVHEKQAVAKKNKEADENVNHSKIFSPKEEPRNPGQGVNSDVFAEVRDFSEDMFLPKSSAAAKRRTSPSLQPLTDVSQLSATVNSSHVTASESPFSPKTASPLISPPKTASPFMTPLKTALPFTPPPKTASPYTSYTETASPFTTPPKTASPFTTPPKTASPYTSYPETASPFTTPKTASPYTSYPETASLYTPSTESFFTPSPITSNSPDSFFTPSPITSNSPESLVTAENFMSYSPETEFDDM